MNKVKTGKWFKTLWAMLLALVVVLTAIPTEVYEAARITHGTSNKVIREDMLTTEIPSNYKVNEATQGKAEDGKYNEYFLDENIQTVELTIDENNLNYLLQNAKDEPYVMAESVTIGDATVGYVGFRTKGNYTLQHAYDDNPGSDRFSFTINFGKYVKKAEYGKTQDFFGCNKISFNNFFFDKTMMKEFFALKLMDEMGLPTPQHGLAKLYINGEYYGVYAMVEALDESILEQYYGVDDDELSSYLCKPTGSTFKYKDILENDAPLWEHDEDKYADVEDMLPTVKEWLRKINCLSEGTDFDGNKIDVNSDTYLELLGQLYDLDEVVKYFATHSWLCQMDNMFVCQQNFGLYVDQNGKAIYIPWDYDLSFGCFFPSTAEKTANYDVDIMYQNNMHGTITERFYKNYPLFNVIYQNDALMEKYHGYMKECSKIAALGGTVESTGKSYEPGYFNYYIETLKEELITAASEKLADNVYYMNNIRQPGDVRNGISDLARIIAMRAVGVYTQIEGIDTTVSGAGCNLENLGNGMRGENSTRGNVTSVDPSTGIFAIGDYGNSNRKEVRLNLTKLTPEETYYNNILQALGCNENKLTVYSIKNASTPINGYTLTVPLSQEGLNAGKTYSVYYCTAEGETTLLEGALTENLYTVEAEYIRYIAIVENGGNIITDIFDSEDGETPWGIIIVVACIAVLVVIIVVVMMMRGKKTKTTSNIKTEE